MVMLPAAAIGIILSPVAGAAFDKFGPRGVGIGGLALMTISLGLLGKRVSVHCPLLPV